MVYDVISVEHDLTRAITVPGKDVIASGYELTRGTSLQAVTPTTSLYAMMSCMTHQGHGDPSMTLR